MVVAIALRLFYPPLPRSITFLKPVSGAADVGKVAFESRLVFFKSASIQAVGLPDESAPTLQTLRGYVAALQATSEKVDVILSASTLVDQSLELVCGPAHHAPIRLTELTLPELTKDLRALIAQDKKVLLIFASVDASHRMLKSPLITLEKNLGQQIPAIIFSALALREGDEAQLVPPCEGNPFSDEGRVSDLACNILSLSRRGQVEHAQLDQDLVSIEEESNDEELVAIFKASR